MTLPSPPLPCSTPVPSGPDPSGPDRPPALGATAGEGARHP
ncbi:hypothetical protein ACFZBM_30310 [Streptomyces lavendulae]|uniref:Uncharacterized protein n=1 Tax=Streptomyces lavendulae subsp. lavendulae TaxID=58340 RepID=A0A2K8PR61_STRLA|nr:hypothetical protein [Streptomyces lavendulae]ATZ29237.1 hypothetical protein SLAV_37360 [Streptomyces lavendulae subsp. lavendulae]QUQ59053.1 hypothetical protein SLLC_35520 [Streptomyces lavendulae subsp. lavendulae]